MHPVHNPILAGRVFQKIRDDPDGQMSINILGDHYGMPGHFFLIGLNSQARISIEIDLVKTIKVGDDVVVVPAPGGRLIPRVRISPKLNSRISAVVTMPEVHVIRFQRGGDPDQTSTIYFKVTGNVNEDDNKDDD
jgi:hypothetical protein